MDDFMMKQTPTTEDKPKRKKKLDPTWAALNAACEKRGLKAKYPRGRGVKLPVEESRRLQRNLKGVRNFFGLGLTDTEPS